MPPVEGVLVLVNAELAAADGAPQSALALFIPATFIGLVPP